MFKREIVQSPASGENLVKKIRFADDASELMTSICGHPDCGIMFDETIDTYVYKCQACKNYFHEDCFMNEFSQTGKCPYCQCDSKCIQ